ncbi:MAG: DUF2007 domain-containing protein [Proteobacteria bacterium]|mgnify:FL=1|nr:DUF2007 domain-containing protein [Pseudomonadota bacterium]
MPLVNLHTPQTESELAVLVAMLEGYGIRCLVQGQHFGSLYPGLQMLPQMASSIMVAQEDERTARDLLQDFLDATD